MKLIPEELRSTRRGGSKEGKRADVNKRCRHRTLVGPVQGQVVGLVPDVLDKFLNT